jgi:DNA-binding NtrC family response regulator
MSEPESVLLVEDDDSLRNLLEQELAEIGLSVSSVTCAEQALEFIARSSPTLVVCDLRLPKLDGIGLLDRLQAGGFPRVPPFVIISAFGTVDRAVTALKRGAADFLTKPLNLEHLRLRIQRLLEVERLKNRVSLQAHGSVHTPFHSLIGQSPVMLRLIESIRRVAAGRGPVLIAGDSGVGKELVARAIHAESTRGDGPFVAVNCASVPENLLESEFFGHESGSFTGAIRRHQGLFAAAHGGSILLDEVGELPNALQAKLLRVLQEGAVRRVGAAAEIPVDVRVLTATNRDLEEDIALGRFRKDLFYRLGTFVVEVPSLAERRGDIELLTAHFLSSCAAQAGKPVEGLSSEVLEHLRRYPFPGNVRELENIVEHAVTFCTGSMIELQDLPRRLRAHGVQEADAREFPAALLAEGEVLTLDELSKRYTRRVLEATSDNKRRAAKLLGISRQTLYRYLR